MCDILEYLAKYIILRENKISFIPQLKLEPITLRLWVRVPPGVQGDQIHEFVKKITLLVIMRSVSF